MSQTQNYAHTVLLEKVRSTKKCLVSMLNEGSRDFDVLRHFVDEYVSYQTAADIVSGQTKCEKVAV